MKPAAPIFKEGIGEGDKMTCNRDALERAADSLRAIDRYVGERPWHERQKDAETCARTEDLSRDCFGAFEWLETVEAVIHEANKSP